MSPVPKLSPRRWSQSPAIPLNPWRSGVFRFDGNKQAGATHPLCRTILRPCLRSGLTPVQSPVYRVQIREPATAKWIGCGAFASILHESCSVGLRLRYHRENAISRILSRHDFAPLCSKQKFLTRGSLRVSKLCASSFFVPGISFASASRRHLRLWHGW